MSAESHPQQVPKIRVPPQVAWLLVTLSISGIVYDLGRRAVARHR
ncbi:hypothetical protein ACFY4I_10070 [Streptomyces scabiei]